MADVIAAVAEVADQTIVRVRPPEAPEPNDGPRLARVLLRGYGLVDARVFGRGDDPTTTVDLASRGPATPEVSQAHPDLVILLDGRDEPLTGWPEPRLGTLSLTHGPALPAAVRSQGLGLPPGGRELLLRQSVTSSVVTSSDARVLGQVVSRVDPLSMRRGAIGHLRKMPGLVRGAIDRAVAGDEIHPAPSVAAPSRRSRPLSSPEIGWRLVGLLAGYLQRWMVRSVAPTRWVVAVSNVRDDPRSGGVRDFVFLDAPAGTEWTDPFPVRTAEADLVFVEEFDLKRWRGRIVVVELEPSGRGWRSSRTILELPHHLSYPFVFEWKGDWYLLPEQAATGRLDLYVAEAFPTTWRWHSTLLGEPASDATIVQIDGRWWMFAAMAVPGGIAADDLHLYFADSPLGPWQPHARNPVVSDVRTARPGGRVYLRDGVWYRVAQDGAIDYGHSLAIIRIDRIDLEDYAETVVDVIGPTWAPGLVATHTINTHDGLTAIDGLRRRPRFRR